MKIAKFKNVKYDFEVFYSELSGEFISDEYVRVSEYIDVMFHMLPSEDVNKQQLAIVDKQIEECIAESEVKLNGLKSYRAELLAIGSDS